MIVSKLNSELIGNLLYLRNVENITEINNKKMISLTIRKYHKMYKFILSTIEKFVMSLLDKKCLE
jgi:hypothetical protein